MAVISCYEKNKVYVVSISGEITHESVGEINEYLKPILAEIKQNKLTGMILDCKKVTMIDSSGIGMICGKHISLKKEGKRFVLCNLNDRLWKVFQATKLTGNLTIYSNIHEAIMTVGVDGNMKKYESDQSSTETNEVAANRSVPSLDDFMNYKRR